MANLKLPLDGSIGQGEDQIAFQITETADGDAIDVFANNGSAITAVSNNSVAITAQHGIGASINLPAGIDERVAVLANSKDTAAVMGISQDNVGLFGVGADGIRGVAPNGGKGVVGVCGDVTNIQDTSVRPDSNSGIWGESNKHRGVIGFSNAHDGVLGITTHPAHAGVAGINKSGGIAGQFVGDVNVTGDVHANNIHCTDCIIPHGADCAEEFDSIEPERVQPGSVMSISSSGELMLSRKAYDSCVVGIVSGAGGFKPGMVLGQSLSQSNRVVIALMGRVGCNVDADYAPIRAGDLLTSSPTPGHAMKAADPSKSFGTVIGKALADCNRGRAIIPTLVTLQ